MKTVPFTNNTDKPVTAGGKVIKPGETRPVDARFVPASVTVNANLKFLYFNLGKSSKFLGDAEIKPDAWARVPANTLVNPNTAVDKIQNGLFDELLKKPVEYIKERFSAFEADELVILKQMEEGGSKRRSLLDAIDACIKSHQVRVSFDPDGYQRTLTDMDEKMLQLELLNVQDDERRLVLVQSALAALKEKAEE